jgi:hypothetical protein
LKGNIYNLTIIVKAVVVFLLDCKEWNIHKNFLRVYEGKEK